MDRFERFEHQPREGPESFEGLEVIDEYEARYSNMDEKLKLHIPITSHENIAVADYMEVELYARDELDGPLRPVSFSEILITANPEEVSGQKNVYSTNGIVVISAENKFAPESLLPDLTLVKIIINTEYPLESRITDIQLPRLPE